MNLKGLALVVAVSISTGGAVSMAAYREATLEGTIVAMGDSLTEGFGVSEDEAYPALLEYHLRSAGYRFRVINTGVSGETSSGALSRISWMLKLKPDIVILETGANDGLRGVDPAVTEENISKILGILAEHDVTVVLAGMRMVVNLGKPYTDAFEGIYPALAKRFGVVYMPFFLENIAGDPSLNLGDGIHPNPAGYKIIAENILPYVRAAIEKWRTKRP